MTKENKSLSRSELISNFVITNPEYYIKEFKKIGVNLLILFHLIFLLLYWDQFGLV